MIITPEMFSLFTLPTHSISLDILDRQADGKVGGTTTEGVERVGGRCRN